MSAALLRTRLNERAHRYALNHKLFHMLSDGSRPAVMFGCDEAGRHGNFHPASYRSILNNPNWRKRLQKVHTSSRRMRVRADWDWKELDCASSSDALLMNIFCHPRIFSTGGVEAFLGLTGTSDLTFGYRARVPLIKNQSDRTEIDLRIGSLLIEAKLTESDFQCAPLSLLERYRDFPRLFEVDRLPKSNGKIAGYQLIRGVLAAEARGASFAIFCDRDRNDLLETWFTIMSAVTSFELRCALKVVTWQELASALPDSMQAFLAEKYGIEPEYC